MTDFADACYGCGGHRRQNLFTSKLCPECTELYERGEITMFGEPVPVGERVPYTPIRFKTLDDGREQVAA